MRVVVSAHDDLVAGGLAPEYAGDVVGSAGVHVHLVVHRQGGSDGAALQLLLQLAGIGQTDGQGGDVVRAADILAVQGVIGDLGKAAGVGSQDGGGSLVLGLQHGIGDPPVIALVDIDENDLAGHVQTLVIPHGSLARIDQLGGDALRRGGGSSVGIDRIVLSVHGEAGAVELPAVALGGSLFHIGQADILHQAGQIIGGGVFGVAAGISSALLRVEVGGIGGQFQGGLIGKAGGDGTQIAGVLLLQRGHSCLDRSLNGIGRCGAAGRKAGKQGKCEQRGQDFFQSCFLLG